MTQSGGILVQMVSSSVIFVGDLLFYSYMIVVCVCRSAVDQEETETDHTWCE